MKASCLLDYVSKSVPSRLREVVILLFTAIEWPFLEYCVRFWASQYIRNTGKLKWVQQRTTEVARGLKHVMYEKSRAWDTWLWWAWRRGIWCWSSTARCTGGDNTEADSSQVYHQEWEAMDTGYGEEDSDCIWRKKIYCSWGVVRHWKRHPERW